MRRGTIVLFAFLVMIVVSAVLYFQQHQGQLMAVTQGSMSMSVKKRYWDLGIDCQEVYEVQGYESPEGIYKMFSLTQHQFYQLNPGVGMTFKQGDTVCVRGLFDVSAHAMNNFFPLVVGGVLAAAGGGAALWAAFRKPAQPQGAS